ncbi:MAG: hypothetical protein AAF514_06130, partial [Verrucomicrobiota bacterium]
RLLLEYNRIPTRIANRERSRLLQRDWLNRLPAVKKCEPVDHFTTLFRLLTRKEPVVLAFDDLDQFHHHKRSAFSLVCFLEQLREAVPRCFQVISVSEDVWKSAFEGGVPEALKDRMTIHRMDLGGLAAGERRAFLTGRLKEHSGSAETIESFLKDGPWSRGPDDGGKRVLPRTLLREAAAHWDRYHLEHLPEATEPPRDWQDAFDNVGHLISFRRSPAIGLVGRENENGSLEEADADPPVPEDLQKVLIQLKGRGARQHDYLPKWPGEERDESEQMPLPLEGEASMKEERPRSLPPELFRKPEHLRSRYERLVGKLIEGPRPDEIEWATLKALVQGAGETFPIIQQETVEVLGAPGCYALRWRTEAGEIWMGFEPYSNIAYWRALSGFLKKHAMVVWAKDRFRAKLMVFLHENHPDGFHKVWNANRKGFSSAPYVDIIQLDREHLGRLYAVEQLLHEGRLYEAVPGKPNALNQLVAELDFFWRRITRPTALAK